MILKAERDRDKAICEATTQGRWIAVQPRSQEGGMNLLHAGPTWGDEFPVATSIRLADRVMLVSWEEHAANAAFVVTAHDRLPLYIADAEELDRRIETLADIAADPETNHATASVLRDAVKILRGET